MDRKLAKNVEEIRSALGAGGGPDRRRHLVAESGIPTFRGSEGYWVVGSKNYLPQEMATREMFDRRPEEVWRVVPLPLRRLPGASPTPATPRWCGWSRRSASASPSSPRTSTASTGAPGRGGVFAIHGDAAWVRCAAECGLGRIDQPDLGERPGRRRSPPAIAPPSPARAAGSGLRPHVLWFDECYDEENYSMDSALRAAGAADLLLVVGTSGATNLPMQIGRIAFHRGAALVDVNPEENPFAELAERSERGFFARGRAASGCPGSWRRSRPEGVPGQAAPGAAQDAVPAPVQPCYRSWTPWARGGAPCPVTLRGSPSPPS